MLALSPLLIRTFAQTQSDSPVPSPIVLFLLPDQTVTEPVVPILVAVTLPSELSDRYQLSDIFVFADDVFIPVSPLVEEPFTDLQTGNLVWLFFGSLDLSQISDSHLPNFTVSLLSQAFFDPVDPSLSSLSPFDQLTLSASLPPSETVKETGEKAETSSGQTGKSPSEGEATSTEGRLTPSTSTPHASSKNLAPEKATAQKAIAKDPKTARKVFEQEIAAKALSNAKKNPKSTAKGNGMVITVGAYPDVLPADGKSTAFIVAKVTDEKGNPLPGKTVRFSADGGKLLVPQALTDETGVALSRVCSEVLKKGQRKVVTVKAKTNPEVQTQVVMDGNLAQVTSANYSTHISFAWCPNLNAGSNGVACSQGGEIGGGAQVEFYIKQNIQGEFYPYFWINFIKVLGDGHPRQVGLSHPGRNSGTSGAYCRPSFIPGQEALFTSTVGPGDLTWTRFHHGNVTVVINYTLARYTPPWEPPQMVTGEVSITGTARNAVLKVSENSPPLLAWDPDNPPDESRRTVIFKVESLQSGNITAVVRIYRAGRSNNERPVKEIWVEGNTNQNIPVVWDGTMDGGEGLNYAERGLYAYDIQFWLPQFFSDIDEDRKVSPYMTIERATDGNGQQIFETEYYGYDDKGTEEEHDDEHIYFIRWYVLKCQSAQYDNDGDALIDRDGDGWIKEDWIDGRDDDNDGLVDEDPLGWDEDPPDGIDNDRDGLTDEDGPDPVNASKGEIILYDPDLEPVKTWDLQSLLCLEHNANDGLVASLEGVRHGVLVPVPVSLMQKAGTYYFVLRVWDNHANLHKDHQVKPALEMSAKWKTPTLLLSWAPMRQGQQFGINPGNGKPQSALGKRLFPDLPVPPDQLPPNDDRDAYRKAKVIVQVWDEPNTTKTVYLRLFDPDDPSAPDTEEELPIDSNDEIVQNPEGGISFIRRIGDNRSDGTGIPSSGIFETSKSTDHQVIVNLNEKGYGMAEAIVILSRQPGNNFKVAGAFEEVVRNGLHIKEGTQEQALRVWTSDNKRVPEGNEPDIIPVARATELLTVWRRLHVEVDSMGEGPFLFADPDDRPNFWENDPSRDVPDPVLTALEKAMLEAYVQTLKIQPKEWNQPSTTWIHAFAGRLARRDYCQSFRQSTNHPDFWAVYVIGIYELGDEVQDERSPYIFDDKDDFPTDWDNDPNQEPASIGESFPFTTTQYAQHALVAMEELRDVAVQHNFTRDQRIHALSCVVAHEIGHLFFLDHSRDIDPQDLMWPVHVFSDDSFEAKLKDVPMKWKKSDIARIRERKYPGD